MTEPQTAKPGFINRNGQVVIRNTGKPGTDHGQSVYQLGCSGCGHVYGANGSDIFERRCPKHRTAPPASPCDRPSPVAAHRLRVRRPREVVFASIPSLRPWLCCPSALWRVGRLPGCRRDCRPLGSESSGGGRPLALAVGDGAGRRALARGGPGGDG